MIKINKELSHEFVCYLPQELEAKIMKEVRKEIATLLLTEDEKQEAIQNANDSKLCDLTDTITIEFI